MKKLGLVAGVSFLAGTLFFALFFGFFQPGTVDNGIDISQAGELNDTQNDTPNSLVLSQPVLQADARPVRYKGFNFAPLVKKVRPAVVKVMSTSMRRRSRGVIDQFFNRRPRRERVPGMGSGFIISQDGYIITNNHVVKDAIKVTIKTIDQKEHTARIIGTDPKTDLALLKINGDNLPFISLGDSNKVEVGEWVLAIGNPLNQDLTVTAGIISAKGRQLGVADYEDFLQTDAAINMGNSGGPLINMEGRVIGINSAILAPSGGNIGIGFAIPSSMAEKVITDLKTKGRVVRGHMGINIDYMNEEDAKEFDLLKTGALVTKVEKDSPADIAGLKRFDLITRVNGKRITSATDISNKIGEARPDDIVEVEFYRENKKNIIKIKVAEAADTLSYITPGDEGRSFDLGMVLVENTRALARQFRIETSRGLFVKNVKRNSAADDNGIRSQDIILEANGKDLTSVEQFRDMVAARAPGSVMLLYVHRNGDEGTIRFRLPQ